MTNDDLTHILSKKHPTPRQWCSLTPPHLMCSNSLIRFWRSQEDTIPRAIRSSMVTAKNYVSLLGSHDEALASIYRINKGLRKRTYE